MLRQILCEFLQTHSRLLQTGLRGLQDPQILNRRCTLIPLIDWDITNYAASSAAPAPASGLSTNQAYELVASRIPPVPEHCIELCSRLGGTVQDVRDRADRAWIAGCWARAALDAEVPKPRPTGKLPTYLKPQVYIILKAKSIAAPTRVACAADYFKLVPRFEDSISHSFPSLAEGKVYCIGAGVRFPDPWEQ